ncbi:sensor histidine kinase [Clostridium magnum]|uniref:histidine kinase n=1 Tax=Clostridium magnum DSM 2767 TaxID=1121326 RepID=A0A161XAK6_9CLOT|nr:HAMP domain-containing sensor histidine kinase [Clostridium magnum]KZL91276.1 sensor histidine kinase TodS [Clostridium magnum DSM 2767]SHI35636.1 Signal transduction histidine kinase [Clostridium magnum DSM 2767]
MKNNLGIVICKNFIEELELVLKNINIKNVIVSTFSSECRCVKKEKNASIMEAIRRCEETCSKIIIICGTCCKNLNKLTVNKYKLEIYRTKYCFELFTNKDIILDFISKKLYLLTPGKLKKWEKDINAWEINRENIAKIRLLDTGIHEDSLKKLEEISEYLDIPCDSFFIGIDVFTMFIEKCILQWKLECEREDISEHKRTENLRLKIQEQSKLLGEAMEYDKLKKEFFANLSHEFKTPLNVMTSTLQLLKLIGLNGNDSENEEKIKQYYDIMNQNCYRLLRLVNNLIDITKIDTGYFKINLRNENVITVIEDITLAVTSYAKNKGLEVTFDTDIEEKVMACDAEKIERIILNLLSNAIKFTPAGGKILVSIVDKNSSIIVSVKDNGVGIPYAMQKSIFERFIQVDKSFSRNREGSGIGLSLVKSLVEMHGGVIGILSEYGKGSEFVIKLPVRVLSEEQTTILEANIARANSAQRISIEFSDIYD